ncbi:MAG: hypothetical protein HRF45_00230 [Fimbriimonadia bacterium]|jgi:hypothetical protein
MQHADQNWFIVILYGLFAIFILSMITLAKRGKQLYIRRIAGLTAIDEAVGRALEMGRPILMVPGIGGLNIISVQALQIFAYITKTAARYGNPIRLTCIDAAVYAVAQEIVQDAYRAEDRAEAYDPDSVRFIAAQQFAFAAGVAGLIQRERVAAAFLLGEFFAESLILAESGNIVGAIQVAGSTQTTQTPFFVAACDYVIIGDEFYAGSAFLSREPVLMGSIVGQDLCKALILLSILVGVICVSIATFTGNEELMKFKGLFGPGGWDALFGASPKGGS